MSDFDIHKEVDRIASEQDHSLNQFYEEFLDLLEKPCIINELNERQLVMLQIALFSTLGIETSAQVFRGVVRAIVPEGIVSEEFYEQLDELFKSQFHI